MRTMGVEEEYLLVGPDGRPVPRAAAVLANDAADDGVHRETSLGDLGEELAQQQVETGTPVCTSIDELDATIRGARTRAQSAAAHVGAGIVALATSPHPVVPAATSGDRYARMRRLVALTASEQLTSGCHVHVGVVDDDEGVAVIDRIQPWLAVLIALSANSPYWHGEDTGYESFRTQVWYRWPSSGPVAAFGSAAAYRASVDALLRTGAILDEGMVYFDVRLSHRYPTVEVRVADVCLDADDAVLVAALTRGLVETAAREAAEGHPAPQVRVEELRLRGWRASRSGLRGELVGPESGRPEPAHDVVDQLVDHVGEALRDAGDLDRVRALWDRLRTAGTGSTLQRRWYEEQHDHRAVVAKAQERTLA